MNRSLMSHQVTQTTKSSPYLDLRLTSMLLIMIARLNAIVRREREQSHRNHAVLTRRLRNKEVG